MHATVRCQTVGRRGLVGLAIIPASRTRDTSVGRVGLSLIESGFGPEERQEAEGQVGRIGSKS